MVARIVCLDTAGGRILRIRRRPDKSILSFRLALGGRNGFASGSSAAGACLLHGLDSRPLQEKRKRQLISEHYCFNRLGAGHIWAARFWPKAASRLD